MLQKSQKNNSSDAVQDKVPCSDSFYKINYFSDIK